MATITIRNLDEKIKRKLQLRAALNGRSMEAEVRELLSGLPELSVVLAKGRAIQPAEKPDAEDRGRVPLYIKPADSMVASNTEENSSGLSTETRPFPTTRIAPEENAAFEKPVAVKKVAETPKTIAPKPLAAKTIAKKEILDPPDGVPKPSIPKQEPQGQFSLF
jgi:plasmid stability protein